MRHLPSRLTRALLALFSAASLLSVATPGRALDSKTPTNASVLPVVVTAGVVPAMLGAGVGEISAFACGGAGLRPIPYQIDEINAEGLVVSYFGKEDRVAPDATPGTLDEDDQIVFMLRDAGGACDSESLSRLPGTVAGVRLESGHLNEPAIVYLMRSRRGLKPLVSYVRYDAAEHQIGSDHYTWRYAPERPFMIADMIYPMFKGRESVDIQDRLRVRIKATGPAGLVNLNFNEEDVDIHLKGVRTGPIRLVREMEGAINVIPGFSLPVSLTFINYDRLWIADVRFRVPAPAALFVGSLDLRVVSDFIDLRGTRISTKAMPEGVLVDGQMIAEEETLQFGDEPWYLVTGSGLNQVVAVDYDRSLNLNASSYFIDNENLEEPPEDVPGCVPCVGYQFLHWEDLKPQKYRFTGKLSVLPAFPEGGGSGFYRTLNAPVTVSAFELSAGES